jgi:hypothetical protein
LARTTRSKKPASAGGGLLDDCLKSGISAVAITYRLSDEAKAPAQFLDSARAIQFIRSKARESASIARSSAWRFKEKMDAFGIECQVATGVQGNDGAKLIFEFVKRHFGMK